jgi:two-component system, NtrC family, sensor kinase
VWGGGDPLPGVEESLFKLSQMSESDIESCGRSLRSSSESAASMEDCAGKVVGYLYDSLVHDRYHAKACALVRFYKTHAYADLDGESRDFAKRLLGGTLDKDDMRCLTLLSTIGENPEWNDRRNSTGHRAIPLPNESFMERIPMIWRMVSQLGINTSQIIRPDPVEVAETYDVFYVDEAVGSPYIPAQEDFVIPYGVRSVLGFGGLLSSGDLFVVILFAKVSVSLSVAQRFSPLALDVRAAVEDFVNGPIYAENS